MNGTLKHLPNRSRYCLIRSRQRAVFLERAISHHLQLATSQIITAQKRYINGYRRTYRCFFIFSVTRYITILTTNPITKNNNIFTTMSGNPKLNQHITIKPTIKNAIHLNIDAKKSLNQSSILITQRFRCCLSGFCQSLLAAASLDIRPLILLTH